MSRLIRENVPATGGKVLDVGSYGVNGTYRELFDPKIWSYTGLDVVSGPNVDVVARRVFDWPIGDGEFDLVISGQAFEHISYFWATMIEIARVLRPAGHAVLLAPSRGPQHRVPADCWRFYPDGFTALASWSGLELTYVTNPWKRDSRLDSASMARWGDTGGVFRKPVNHNGKALHDLKTAMTSYISNLTDVDWTQHEIELPAVESSYRLTELAKELTLGQLIKVCARKLVWNAQHPKLTYWNWHERRGR
jgi:SAM-dependent methyltransferase